MDGIAIVNRKIIRPSVNNNPILKEEQVNLEGAALPDNRLNLPLYLHFII